MSRVHSPSDFLKPIASADVQSHLGRGLHTLGLIDWLLKQTGPASVYVSTFSTSDAFLRGFWNLRKKGLVPHAVLLADLKASRKTFQLQKQMQRCFDEVYLAMNHSKVVLIANDQYKVTVISSQNQTYGDRAECTLVTSLPEIFEQQLNGLIEMVDNATELNGLFSTTTEQDH